MVSMTLSITLGAMKFAKNTYKAIKAAKVAKAAGQAGATSAKAVLREACKITSENIVKKGVCQNTATAIGKHIGKEVGKALVGEAVGLLSRELTDLIQKNIFSLVKSSFEKELKEKIF